MGIDRFIFCLIISCILWGIHDLCKMLKDRVDFRSDRTASRSDERPESDKNK